MLLEKEGQIPVYEQHAAKYGVDVWACGRYSSVSNLQALSEHIKSLQQNVDGSSVLIGIQAVVIGPVLLRKRLNLTQRTTISLSFDGSWSMRPI